MGRVTRRDAVAIILVALVCGIVSALPPLDFIHRWSIDALTALRWEVFGMRHDPASAPVVVVAIDEETYQTPPFKGSPTLTWTTEIGRVLTAVIDGGAKVVGFDIVFPASIEQSELPFGDDLLGARVRGFDRAFLRSLAMGSSAGKVVLGEVLGGDRPSPGQRIAVAQQKNIRALNVYLDPDDVVRKVPLTFPSDGKRVPSMALELASRALNAEPALAEDGSVALAGYRIPGVVPNTLTLNFDGGGNDVPTFSFADLRACVERNNADFFRREFTGKIVIFGTVLNSEDRKLTSKRFATGLDGSRAARCALPPAPPVAGQFKRSSIAGVYAWRLGRDCPPEYRPKNDAETEALKKEADFAFKQAFAFCPYSPEAVYRYVNFLLNYNRLDDALIVAKRNTIAHTLDQSFSHFKLIGPVEAIDGNRRVGRYYLFLAQRGRRLP